MVYADPHRLIEITEIPGENTSNRIDEYSAASRESILKRKSCISVVDFVTHFRIQSQKIVLHSFINVIKITLSLIKQCLYIFKVFSLQWRKDNNVVACIEFWGELCMWSREFRNSAIYGLANTLKIKNSSQLRSGDHKMVSENKKV